MWVCPWHGAHTEVREQLVRVDLCLSHVGSRDRSQLVRLGRQRLCPPSHLIRSQECIPEQQTVWSCCFSVCDGYVWSMHMYAVAHVCTLETWEGWWMPCYLTLYPIFFFFEAVSVIELQNGLAARKPQQSSCHKHTQCFTWIPGI